MAAVVRRGVFGVKKRKKRLWKPLKMVGVAELESATFCVSCRRSNQLSYTPEEGGRIIGRRGVLTSEMLIFFRGP